MFTADTLRTLVLVTGLTMLLVAALSAAGGRPGARIVHLPGVALLPLPHDAGACRAGSRPAVAARPAFLCGEDGR